MKTGILVKIEKWNIESWGKLTPIALIEVGGESPHLCPIIEDFRNFAIGDTVSVHYNDKDEIRPKLFLVEKASPSKEIIPPSEIDGHKVDSGYALHGYPTKNLFVHHLHPFLLKARTVKMCTKLKINGLNEKTINSLFENGLLETPSDLTALSNACVNGKVPGKVLEALESLLGKSKTKKILGQIALKLSTLRIDQFIGSFQIPALSGTRIRRMNEFSPNLNMNLEDKNSIWHNPDFIDKNYEELGIRKEEVYQIVKSITLHSKELVETGSFLDILYFHK